MMKNLSFQNAKPLNRAVSARLGRRRACEIDADLSMSPFGVLKNPAPQPAFATCVPIFVSAPHSFMTLRAAIGETAGHAEQRAAMTDTFKFDGGEEEDIAWAA